MGGRARGVRGGPALLTRVRWAAVLFGAVAATLLASLVALPLWALLAATGFGGDPALVALTVGVLVALFTGGWVGGRMATQRHPFHGALAALLFAALVVVVSVTSGSPTGPGPVALLASLAIALGGLGGIIGGRRWRSKY
jgi:putative membrane protein (TIGR04086 family)